MLIQQGDRDAQAMDRVAHCRQRTVVFYSPEEDHGLSTTGGR
jgi:hypothetical protein